MNKKNKNKAILGTIVFHLLLALTLVFFGLTTPLPLPEEEGVEVLLGGGGGGAPGDYNPNEQDANPQQTQSSNDEELVTQEVEETPMVQPKTITTPNETNKNKTVEKESQEVNKNALFPSNSGGGGEGSGEGSGQGSGTGTGSGSGEGSGDGSGDGAGTGIGKAIYKPPAPELESLERPVNVLVRVYVDMNGQVTRAISGIRGSETTNQNLLEIARKTALKYKFSRNPNMPERSGIITIRFTHPG